MKTTWALALDTELDLARPSYMQMIEIGITSINLETREIAQSWSFPISYGCRCDNWVSPEIKRLTGWTAAKLTKQGEPLHRVLDRLSNKLGAKNRLIVVDHDKEFDVFGEDTPFGNNVINVSTIFALQSREYDARSLEYMLKYYCLEFEGTPHRARDDSRNIAKLFLTLFGGHSHILGAI